MPHPWADDQAPRSAVAPARARLISTRATAEAASKARSKRGSDWTDMTGLLEDAGWKGSDADRGGGAGERQADEHQDDRRDQVDEAGETGAVNAGHAAFLFVVTPGASGSSIWTTFR